MQFLPFKLLYLCNSSLLICNSSLLAMQFLPFSYAIPPFSFIKNIVYCYLKAVLPRAYIRTRARGSIQQYWFRSIFQLLIVPRSFCIYGLKGKIWFGNKKGEGGVLWRGNQRKIKREKIKSKIKGREEKLKLYIWQAVFTGTSSLSTLVFSG